MVLKKLHPSKKQNGGVEQLQVAVLQAWYSNKNTAARESWNGPMDSRWIYTIQLQGESKKDQKMQYIKSLKYDVHDDVFFKMMIHFFQFVKATHNRLFLKSFH